MVEDFEKIKKEKNTRYCFGLFLMVGSAMLVGYFLGVGVSSPEQFSLIKYGASLIGMNIGAYIM